MRNRLADKIAISSINILECCKYCQVVCARAINGRVGDMSTKIPNCSNRDVSTVLLARLEKLDSVHRKPSILKHQGGAGEGN